MMGTNKNISQKDWEQLARQLYEDPASPGKEDVESIFVDEAEKKRISELSEKVDLYFKIKQYNTPKAYAKVNTQIHRRKAGSGSRIVTLRTLKIAAAIVLALLVVSAAYFVGKQQLSGQTLAEIKVDDSGLSQVELADGTIVTLNRDSKINYPDQFGSNKREVFIEGEAFFEVTPDPNKPFIIRAGEATIKVLGTSFTVNAYPGSDRIEVIVATGKVQFSKNDIGQSMNRLLLNPGEKGIFESVSKQLVKSLNADPNYLAWKTRSFVFSETSLKEVISQLNKVYRVQIELNDLSLNDLLLNAHFENEPLDFILKVISETHGLSVSRTGEHYLLKKEA
ncbi:FecR family protein [Sunxiuqinia indica]|uniref:FecR family protein n=1 Tax=Sunxiuqinia indica TaxID=2692584 RepID=UPI00135BB518|nr:FecR domain-containing protein [Sunxiuqinia indica]